MLLAKKKKKKRHWLKNEKKQKGQKKVPDGKTEMRGNVHDWLRLSHSYTHAHTHTHRQQLKMFRHRFINKMMRSPTAAPSSIMQLHRAPSSLSNMAETPAKSPSFLPHVHTHTYTPFLGLADPAEYPRCCCTVLTPNKRNQVTLLASDSHAHSPATHTQSIYQSQSMCSSRVGGK